MPVCYSPFVIFFQIGAVLAGIGVLLGAFGAHALRETLSSEMLEIFETGVRYQMYHALALLAVGWLADKRPDLTLVHRAGVSFAAGIVIFSGSLYLLAITGLRWLGAITPIGGVAFITGWLLLAFAAARARRA